MVSRKVSRSFRGLWLLLMVACCAGALAQQVSPHEDFSTGEAVYNKNCAMCHDHPDASRAPPKSTLNAMTAGSIKYALTEGNMKAYGAGLSEAERTQLIRYLTFGRTDFTPTKDEWSAGMMCPADRRDAAVAGSAPVSDFGFNLDNTRSLTAEQAGLTKAQLSGMELAWAIAIPGGGTMRSQPAVVGQTVFLPVADARSMYAFDVSEPLKPCVKWVFRTSTESPLRTSAAYGVLADGRGVVAFSGFDTMTYLLDAQTGKLLWSKHTGTYAYDQETGTPVVLKDRVLVPMSQYEIVVAARNAATCCTNHGYVLSLDPKDGSQQWRYDTMPEAKPVRDRGDGKFLYGPSGAPIWTSPTVDEKRGLVYIGTGESNSPPVSKNTDAVVAIGLADGKQRWSLQGTDKDIYLSGCGVNPKPDQLNCVKASETVYRDVDFGASMVLAPFSTGKQAVFAGQKSGAVWALDPETGNVLWHNDLGSGSPLGGIHWALAYDHGTVYAPIVFTHDPYLDYYRAEKTPPSPFHSGMYALDAATGKVKWSFATQIDCSPERKARVPAACANPYVTAAAIGMSAAPAVIDGAVVEGTVDGYLYVLDGASGQLLWKYDTTIAYKGINGVDGHGGAIDNAAISAGDGFLFVSSGYNMFGQAPGNVFLAFRPKSH